MFGKWRKVSSILFFTVESIKTCKPYDGRYYVEWVRGSSKGKTDSIELNNDNLAIFNSNFECKCTVYQSKGDGSFRPKIVKFICYRLLNNETKIFGRLSIDVS